MEIETGQIWRYITRPGEENSFAFVGHVTEKSVHFALVGLQIKIPDPRGLIDSKMLRCPLMGHLAITLEKFRESVTELVDHTDADEYAPVIQAMKDAKLKNAQQLLDLYKLGYKSFTDDNGSPFDETIVQIVENMAHAMATGTAREMKDDDDLNRRIT